MGDALAEAGAQALITGTAPEAELVERVRRAMRVGAVEVCGRLSTGGLAGLLARCDLLVSDDSGPRHRAEAAGTPTVGVYWCGNVINAGPMTRRWHRPVISWRLACSECGVDCTRRS